MTENELYQAMSNIDDDLLERSARKPRRTPWLAVAAVLALLLGTGAGFLLSNPAMPEGIKTSVGGIERLYRDDCSAASGEVCFVWPWEYQTVQEQYSTITFCGRQYELKGNTPIEDTETLQGYLGMAQGSGYDSYTDRNYSQQFPVWEITGISSEIMVAAEMDGAYYVFIGHHSEVGKTFGQIVDDYALEKYMTFDRFTAGEEAFLLEDDGDIWQLLKDCENGTCSDMDIWNTCGEPDISFCVTSDVLGVYKVTFAVYREGYLWTNVLNYGYTFYIGQEKAAEICDCAMLQGIGTAAEPYEYRLCGTVTEIHEDYILVDDGVLCVDPQDAMVFRVSLEDLRIRRYVELGKITQGDLVVVSFRTLVDEENGNLITGARDMAQGFLEDSEVYIPE